MTRSGIGLGMMPDISDMAGKNQCFTVTVSNLYPKLIYKPILLKIESIFKIAKCNFGSLKVLNVWWVIIPRRREIIGGIMHRFFKYISERGRILHNIGSFVIYWLRVVGRKHLSHTSWFCNLIAKMIHNSEKHTIMWLPTPIYFMKYTQHIFHDYSEGYNVLNDVCQLF